MSVYRIVPATQAHAEELARTMRLADVEELADEGFLPLPALQISMAGSRDTFAGLVDETVACIFGVVDKGSAGTPWLLGSDLIEQHARVFLRLNRPYIARLRAEFKLLHNQVGARNFAAIRWLEWLGFRVAARVTLGRRGAAVRHFEMRV